MLSLKSFLAALAGFSLAGCSPVALEPRLPGRVVKAGEPVMIDPNGEYIRVSFMNDGSLIAGYQAQENGRSILRVAHSSDGAQSWQRIGEVFSGATANFDMNNAMPLQLPSGRVIYAYRNHDRTGADWHYTYFRISLSYSDDGGRNFKYLSTVAERVPSGVNGLWEPYLRLARDGTLQCYFSAENDAGDQDNFMRYSRDGGYTWSEWIHVSGGNVRSRDGMVGVAPIDNDGNLIAVFENTEDGRFSVNYVTSHDDGYTWGLQRTRLYTARNGGICGAPQDTRPATWEYADLKVVYNVWGTLVASFMTNEDWTEGANGYDGAEMKVITSVDGGRTWSGSVVVGPAHSHWPGIFNRDPTHFLALYSRDEIGAVSQLYELAN
ncbi:hypothetical protein DL770_011637 [Monosporascus sp. CRB-9-2]|nr:hypothetical protein DL770_011637 [Monosporascus sp. CRB-9-2]